MKIVAFAGSNSSTSINKRLVLFTCSLFTEDEIEILDLNNFEAPLFSEDREKNGYPEKVVLFAEKIDSADLLIISLAENNGNYSAAFKNIYDWISRLPNRQTFGEKPMFLMATSGGKRGANSVLKIATERMPFEKSKVIESFSLPSFYNNFNDELGITNEDLKTIFLEKIQTVKDFFK